MVGLLTLQHSIMCFPLIAALCLKIRICNIELRFDYVLTRNMYMQAMRVVEIMVISMRTGLFKEMMEDLGLSMAGGGFSRVPNAGIVHFLCLRAKDANW